jgi:hypothetical protein
MLGPGSPEWTSSSGGGVGVRGGRGIGIPLAMALDEWSATVRALRDPDVCRQATVFRVISQDASTWQNYTICTRGAWEEDLMQLIFLTSQMQVTNNP